MIRKYRSAGKGEKGEKKQALNDQGL